MTCNAGAVLIHTLNIDNPGEDTSANNPTKDKETRAAQKSISQTLTRRLLTDVTVAKRRQASAATNEDEAEALQFPDPPQGGVLRS